MKVATKFVSPLSVEQMETLESLMKNDSSHRVRTRAHCILLSAQGFSIDEICAIHQIHRHSVSSWIEAWEQSEVEGLRDKPQEGGKPKLTASEREIVKELIKSYPQSPKTVLAKLSEAIGKTISVSTLKRIAKAAGSRWKRARKSLKSKRDPKKFEQAKKEIAELKKQHQTGTIDLRFFDESGFSLTPSVPYAWQPTGEYIEIPSARSKRLNVLGFFNTDNQLESFCFEGSINTSVVVACFNEFSETITQKTVVIIDNAPTHTSQEFLENIPEWEKKGLFIKNIPEYSPELNLIEILWRFIKYYWLPFSAYLNFETLVYWVENILRNVGKQYQIEFT